MRRDRSHDTRSGTCADVTVALPPSASPGALGLLQIVWSPLETSVFAAVWIWVTNVSTMVPSLEEADPFSGTMNVAPRTRRPRDTASVFHWIRAPTPASHWAFDAPTINELGVAPVQAPTRAPVPASMVSPPAGKVHVTERFGRAVWIAEKKVRSSGTPAAPPPAGK